jgi:hypothetical protein
MSDLIEAMEAIAEALREEPLNDFSYAARLNVASIALAALRETHHLIPKDQEPVGEAYVNGKGTACVRMTPEYTAEMQSEGYRPTFIYALERRHD